LLREEPLAPREGSVPAWLTSSWTSDVQAIASIIGFVVVIYQIWRLKLTIQGDTHSKLYTHYLEVTKLLLQKPELRPYFYEGKTLDAKLPADAELRQQVEMMSEVFLGLLEHAVLQRKNLPGDSWNNCWKAYVRERYTTSPELARFFRANQKWYAKALCEALTAS
jgi:hypothetical protein